VNFALYMVLGNLRGADWLMEEHGTQIRRVARRLREHLGVPRRPCYRGILVEPEEIPDDRMVLPQEETMQFSSWSEDKDVACWFADRDSVMSAPVHPLSITVQRPRVQGWVMELQPKKSDVLFHHSWADRFPSPDGRATMPLAQIARAGAVGIAQGMAQAGMPVQPENVASQIEWNLRTQQEVVIGKVSDKVRAVPHADSSCAPTRQLDERLGWPGRDDGAGPGVFVFHMNPPKLLEEVIAEFKKKLPGVPAPEELAEELLGAAHVLADEPMRWYWEESDKEHWDEREEFRNIAPPFPLTWIESGAPSFVRSDIHGVTPFAAPFKRSGTLFSAEEAEHADPQIRDQFPGARWIVKATVFTDNKGNTPDVFGAGYTGPKWRFIYGVGHDGRMTEAVGGGFYTEPLGIYRALPRESWEDYSSLFKGPWRVGLLSIYFMHARGTTLKDVPVPDKVRKARQRRGKAPKIRFKILDIGLGARQSLREAKAEGGGSTRALRKHLRRGSWAHYSEEKPHVSGYVGAMWRRHTMVKPDESDEEKIEKEYRVRSKEAKKRQKRRKRKRKKNPHF
jgi:hypothetical protein